MKDIASAKNIYISIRQKFAVMTEKALAAIQKEMKLKTGKLDLRDCGLTEIPVQLSEMTWLVELNLFANRIAEIKGLDQLTQLTKLSLGYNRINDIKELKQLVNLSRLFLTANRITEIKELNHLVNLSQLFLNKNRISKINGLDRLGNLSYLDLSENIIIEIQELHKLINLSSLILSGNQIDEIKNLNRLKNLKKLKLSDNWIHELKNLGKLYYLEELDLSRNPITDLYYLPQLVQNKNLIKLYLFGVASNNLNIPPEHFGNKRDSNCLDTLRGYFASLKKGSFQLNEVPVILVGNSTAGKTSLRYFLQYNVFPPPEDHSTHGIEPSIWIPDEESVENLEDAIKPGDLQLFFWDFGGQEYYHATHRLFFLRKAIYILVWERKTNKQATENLDIKLRMQNGEIESIQLPVELFPYEYWVQSIRHLATDVNKAPIILLQNKIDEPGNDIKENPDSTLLKKNNCDALHLSVKKAYEVNGEGKKDPLVEILLQKIFSKLKDYRQLCGWVSFGKI
jgi:internalin A